MSVGGQPHYRIKLRWFRIFFWPLLLPVALVLALFNKISPVPFRIYSLRVDRIGHLAGNTELFCCRRDLGLIPREFRVFVHRDRPCNPQLLRMWARHLPLRQVFLPLFDICNKLGGLGVVSRAVERSECDDLRNLSEQTPRHIDFEPGEIAEAERQAAALGLPPGRPFVPILGRDFQYLLDHNPHEDNSHYLFRNVNITSYLPTAAYLAERFGVIRAGNSASYPLPADAGAIIDYPFSGRCTDLLDVYWGARCHFYMTCGSGPDTIASQLFRHPTLYTNFIPPSVVPNWNHRSITICKHYWFAQEKRFLRLSEILDNPQLCTYNAHKIREAGVEVIDNTPEEILEATREMVARLDGTWVESEEDAERQIRFWTLYKIYFPERVFVARVGAAFLRDHPQWLD